MTSGHYSALNLQHSYCKTISLALLIFVINSSMLESYILTSTNPLRLTRFGSDSTETLSYSAYHWSQMCFFFHFYFFVHQETQQGLPCIEPQFVIFFKKIFCACERWRARPILLLHNRKLEVIVRHQRLASRQQKLLHVNTCPLKSLWLYRLNTVTVCVCCKPN